MESCKAFCPSWALLVVACVAFDDKRREKVHTCFLPTPVRSWTMSLHLGSLGAADYFFEHGSGSACFERLVNDIFLRSKIK